MSWFTGSSRRVIHVADKPQRSPRSERSSSHRRSRSSSSSESDYERINVVRRDSVISSTMPRIEELPTPATEEVQSLDLSNPTDAQDFISACTIMMNRTALDADRKAKYIGEITANIVKIMRSDSGVIHKVSGKLDVLLQRANNLPHQIEQESLPGIVGQIMGTLSSA